MTESTHRPPAPPQPSTVVAEPATPQACQADFAGRNTDTPETITAAPHTHGRRS